MKMRPLVMVLLFSASFARVCFADTTDESKKAENALRDRLMGSSTLSKIKLLDPQSNFVDSETRRKFEAAFPAKDLAGKPYAYTGLCVTLPELKHMMEGGTVSSPGAVVDRPNEAVSMVYAQSGKQQDTFPVIVQVRPEDAQISGPVKPTGVTVFYKDGFLADAIKPDPGASPGDHYVGTPVLRLATVPDDSTGQSISDVQGDLVSTAGGATKTVHAKEAPAPGHEDGVPQYAVKVLVGDSIVNVAPTEGGAFKPFNLTGGEVNIAVITKDGVKTAANPVLSTTTLENSSKYNVVIHAMVGDLLINTPFFPEPILLKPAKNNYYTDDSGTAAVGLDPALQNRDEKTTTPMVVGEAADRAKLGGGDQAPGEIAKTLEGNRGPSDGG